MIYNNAHIRKLARSSYWQSIYAQAKEIHGIHLFYNTCDFSNLQIEFLEWLEVYQQLRRDLISKAPYMSEKVYNDDIRVEAYLIWKNKNRDNEKKEPMNDGSSKPNLQSSHTMIFTKRRK